MPQQLASNYIMIGSILPSTTRITTNNTIMSLCFCTASWGMAKIWERPLGNSVKSPINMDCYWMWEVTEIPNCQAVANGPRLRPVWMTYMWRFKVFPKFRTTKPRSHWLDTLWCVYLVQWIEKSFKGSFSLTRCWNLFFYCLASGWTHFAPICVYCRG